MNHPDPLVAGGSVDANDDTRTLTIRPHAGGEVARIWYWGHQELMDGEAPAVYAYDAKRKRLLAIGRPARDGSLRFPFCDQATYNELDVANLRASILVDRGNGWIMHVRLHHGRREG